MLVYLFKYLRHVFLNFYFAKERKAIEDERKLDGYLRYLRGEDNEEESTSTGQDSAFKQPDEFNCLKFEGVITSLNEFSGVINDKFLFSKIVAKREWKEMKVGRKLSFLLFEGTVSYIKLHEASWDEIPEVVVIPKDTKATGFNTETRTVIGSISEIANEILVVDTGANQELYIPLSDHPDLKWFFMVGDVLRLECIIQDDAMSWDPTIGSFGNVLSVKSINPNREKHEVGRVSAVYHDYAIIDETVIVSNSTISEEICLWELYEYEAIETSCEVNKQSYYWRLTKLIKRVESENDRCLKEHSEIQMNDTKFCLRLDLHRPVKKFVAIYNNSSESIKLHSSEVTSSSGFVKLARSAENVLVRPNGKYNIDLNIIPRLVGSFIEEITADFGEFKKKSLVKIEVRNDALVVTARQFNNESRELIPGQKVRISPRFVDVRIDSYHVPSEFRKIDFKKNTQLLIRDIAEYYPFLVESLTPENYLMKMRYCLYLEEIAMEIHFARYKIERGHFENKQEFLRLVVEGVAEKRPSLSIGDSIHATDPFPSTQKKSTYEGNIHKVEQNAVLLKFHTNFHSSHGNKDYRIEFLFSRTTFRRQQHSLDLVLQRNGLGLDFLFPDVTASVFKRPQVDVKSDEEVEWFNKNLNKYQKAAVVNVLRGEARPLPYIIYGPPGTGKTQTVVECIEQIAKLPSSRVIVAAPSNSAANLIIDRLIATGRFKGGDIIRFVSFNQIEKNLIPEHLKKFCATIDIGFDDGNAHNMTTDDSGLRLNCSKSVIVQYKIYISTLSSLGPLMQIKFMQEHFTHVIIDEAGQSVETESLIPITFVSKNKGQVILAGDPQQLGPILVSQVAKFCGYDKSLLERLSEHQFYQPINGDFDSRFVTKLKTNYRSLPSILGIYNNLFYDGELVAEVNEDDSPEINLLKKIDEILWNRPTADRKCGVYFVNVSKGQNMRTAESSSWFNNQEAARVFSFVCKLKKQGISMKDIGIITPYALQVKTIRHIIEQALPNCGLKVGTVEEFQGQERQVILVTTVRTNANLLQGDAQFNLGFLQSKKRMNVAISRARALLVVFGKESILGQDENWNHLIQYTKKKGTYTAT